MKSNSKAKLPMSCPGHGVPTNLTIKSCLLRPNSIIQSFPPLSLFLFSFPAYRQTTRCSICHLLSALNPAHVSHIANSEPPMEAALIRKNRRLTYAFIFCGLGLFLLIAHSFVNYHPHGADLNQCRIVYMYPLYAKVLLFDKSHTKFASKYSLYLYREQGKDLVPEDEAEGFSALDGIPVLFIPGNAGSYQQVRSIAAEASNLYFDDNINVVQNPRAGNLDFFAADFNEDFTAFHGRTLLDQAEYLNEAVKFILLLYLDKAIPPTSVIIVAHSMGGIVARTMLTLPTYELGSVNTIITLSSPHSAAPLTFDGNILKLYLAIDRFWYAGFYGQLEAARKILEDVSVVSITGGASDHILPADYTTLGYLVPPTHGFTVYTSGIPHVWTPIDHLAIVWCRQLRRVVLKLLLEITDKSSPARTRPLHERMDIMKRELLSGFEDDDEEEIDMAHLGPGIVFGLKVDPDNISTWKHYTELGNNVLGHGLNVMVTKIPPGSDFVAISSTPIEQLPLRGPANKESYVIACKEGTAEPLISALDENSLSSEIQFQCIGLSGFFNAAPRSAAEVNSLSDSSFDGDYSPFFAARIPAHVLSEYDKVLFISSHSENNSFFVAQASPENTVTVNQSLLSIMIKGAQVMLPASRSLAYNIHFPCIWSSILAFRLLSSGLDTESRFFEPFVRQWKSEPFETKWHIKLASQNSVLITAHGVAPYVPFQKEPASQALNLEFWFEQAPSQSPKIMLSIDWTESLRLLVMRYRLAAVCYCLMVAILVTLMQSLQFNASGTFPDYMFGITKITEPRFVFVLFFILLALTPALRLRSVQTVLNFLDPVVIQDINEINLSLHSDYLLNSFYLGLHETSLASLGCIFFIIAVGLNALVCFIFRNLILVMIIVAHHFPRLQRKLYSPSSQAKLLNGLLGSLTLFTLVSFFFPYQMGYAAAYLLQAFTTTRSYYLRGQSSSFNYHLSILMLMTWVLPINIPILVVFFHNLGVSWSTPFSSHHNLLAVAPIFVVTVFLTLSPDIIPLFITGEGQKPFRYGFIGFLGYFIGYCIIYGARHTYWLHHLFNVWCCFILALYVDQSFRPRKQKG